MIVAGVYYEVDWRKFRKGTSLFFPCLDPRAAQREIRSYLNQIGLNGTYKHVVEQGIRGVRVWRV